MLTNARGINTNRSRLSRQSKNNAAHYNNIPTKGGQSGVHNSLPSGRSEINKSSGGTRKYANQHDSFNNETEILTKETHEI